MFTHIGSAVAIVDIKRNQEAWWNEQYGESEPSRPLGSLGAALHRAAGSLAGLVKSRPALPVTGGD